MKKLLTVAAITETATGLALLVVPSLIGRLLLGAELTGVAVAVPAARVLGIALVALGVACWPDRPALCGMLIYGVRGNWVGRLLWPAVCTARIAMGNETRIELA